MKKIKLELSSGSTFEVEAGEEFFKIVASHFELESVDEVSDKHITEYIYRATRNALEKAEKDSDQGPANLDQIKLV